MSQDLLVATPTSPSVRVSKQLGNDHEVCCDMTDPPRELNALAAIGDHYSRFGLAWESAESGSAIGRIVLSKLRAGLQRATALPV